MKVPFLDLQAQYLSMKDEIDQAIRAVVNDSAFIKGKYVQRFEEEFAALHQIGHCIGVGNGTDAIYVSLKALGVKSGDEVIVPATSWISTSAAVSQAGAKPVFVDVDPCSYTLDPIQVEKKITENTKAIIPVHLYGQPADMLPIQQICNEHGLKVVEDCAQAHLATYAGKRVGTLGDLAAFSFYPSKNLGAYGDAGCILTNNDELAEKCRLFVNQGAVEKHQHLIEGITSRMDGIQAAILSVKLKKLVEWTERRQEVASWYWHYLQDLEGVTLPAVAEGRSHVYHLFVVRFRERDRIRKKLADAGVGTEVHYPSSLPALPAYEHYELNLTEFPIATMQAKEVLSLPMHPALTMDEVRYVCETLRKALK